MDIKQATSVMTDVHQGANALLDLTRELRDARRYLPADVWEHIDILANSLENINQKLALVVGQSHPNRGAHHG